MSVTATVANGIGRLVLDNPPLNILTRAELATLRRELDRLAELADLRVLVLSARGKHFSAGADVGEHIPPHHLTLIPDFLATVARLEAFPLPIIAAVRGKCLGGGFELIQPSDIIVAAEGAAFGQPEILLGLFPPAAVVLLPDRLPRGAVAETIYTGDPLSAADAERRGFVTRLVPDDALERTADELACRIARHSAVALRAAKHALRTSAAGVRDRALRRAGEIYLHELMATRDAVEGLRAFVEKRSPAWSNT
jgi:cyclohexa-1,5-dienecarbonyl-CoA hydratase